MAARGTRIHSLLSLFPRFQSSISSTVGIRQIDEGVRNSAVFEFRYGSPGYSRNQGSAKWLSTPFTAFWKLEIHGMEVKTPSPPPLHVTVSSKGKGEQRRAINRVFIIEAKSVGITYLECGIFSRFGDFPGFPVNFSRSSAPEAGQKGSKRRAAPSHEYATAFAITFHFEFHKLRDQWSESCTAERI